MCPVERMVRRLDDTETDFGNMMENRMDIDFLTKLEAALGGMDDLDEIRRWQVDANGESGMLGLFFEDGRKYSIHFDRSA